MTAWSAFVFRQDMWEATNLASPGNNSPQFIHIDPPVNAANVSPDTTITVRYHDPDYDNFPDFLSVSVNGVTAYDPQVPGFVNGYTGIIRNEFGGSVITVIPPKEFLYGESVAVKAGTQDSAGNQSTFAWIFTTGPHPVCHPGQTRLPVEAKLQTPFDTYIDVEPLREVLMGSVLRSLDEKITNKLNKASRVIYQLAYSTELSTILNPVLSVDNVALSSIVCEQARVVDIAEKTDALSDKTQKAIDGLARAKKLSREQVNTLMDYVDSTAFNYRASVVAVLVLYTAALELNA